MGLLWVVVVVDRWLCGVFIVLMCVVGCGCSEVDSNFERETNQNDEVREGYSLELIPP